MSYLLLRAQWRSASLFPKQSIHPYTSRTTRTLTSQNRLTKQNSAPQRSKKSTTKKQPPPIYSLLHKENQTANPPESTRPAPLDLPPPISATAPLQDKFSRYFKLGKAFLSFYKTGIKNVYYNYRASILYRKKMGLSVYIPVFPSYASFTKPVASSWTSSKSSTSSSSSSTSSSSSSSLLSSSSPNPFPLDRSQHQLLYRSTRDIRRMIPFTLILIICGEFTPLILPFFGSAVTPATCRAPSQESKERVLASKRKRAALDSQMVALDDEPGQRLGRARADTDREIYLLALKMGMPFSFIQYKQEMKHKSFYPSVPDSPTSSAENVLRACAVFGLVKSHDRFLGSLLVPLLYRRRLRNYLAYLATDDALIFRAGGVDALSPEEVRIAVDERGGGDILFEDKVAEVLAVNPDAAGNVERWWLENWLVLREKFLAHREGLDGK